MSDPTAPGDGSAGTRVRLRLFGAFRDVDRRGELVLELPSGSTVATLREHLKAALARAVPARRHERLVDVSALASDAGVLPESHPLAGAEVCLSVLPPVCGG